MIKLLFQGNYRLIETFKETRVLELEDGQRFAWIKAKGIGEILVLTKKKFNQLYTLSRGAFRLYDVKGEPNLTDTQHLELYIGEGNWQGYLLPLGLPDKDDIRNRIVPTTQLLTETSNLRMTR